MSAFVYRHRVRYHECDPQGIVFNANYVMLIDVALTEMWRELFGGYEHLVGDHGVELVVGSLTIDFRSSARPDDLLDIAVNVARLGTTSITSDVLMSIDEVVVAQASIRHVCVDAQNFVKTEVPEAIRLAVAGSHG